MAAINKKRNLWMPMKAFMVLWFVLLGVIIIMGAGVFFVPYLPSNDVQRWRFSLFPLGFFIFFISPLTVALVGQRLGRMLPVHRSLGRVIKAVLVIGGFSLLCGVAFDGFFAFPTSLEGRQVSGFYVGPIRSISGFRREYSSRSWIVVSDGWLPRQFLWPSTSIRKADLKIGDCISVNGKTLGIGIVIDGIMKTDCRQAIRGRG